MAPILSFLLSSGSKKKEPRYVCLSETKASRSYKMWTEVSYSVPHFLNLNVLWVQKRNPDRVPFSFKESRQANPLQVPQRGPYGEKYLLTRHFYLSLNISLFIFPSESPVREPPPCYLTGSPWAAILRVTRATGLLFIHSCMSARVPKKQPSYIHVGKNIRSPST